MMSLQELKSAALGRPVLVQECGLFIDSQRPWLAASPDGIVMDKQTGRRLLCLEVKCPYKHRQNRVEDACREDRAFCLQIQEQEPGEVRSKPRVSVHLLCLSLNLLSSCPASGLPPEDIPQLLHADPVSAGGDGPEAG